MCDLSYLRDKVEGEIEWYFWRNTDKLYETYRDFCVEHGFEMPNAQEDGDEVEVMLQNDCFYNYVIGALFDEW